ncbi:MAG TPA: extracellular solute-binding protein [Chloroflexota bacterium]|nr:extracellular solute-binding protein [Chloroflexota bacterium]
MSNRIFAPTARRTSVRTAVPHSRRALFRRAAALTALATSGAPAACAGPGGQPDTGKPSSMAGEVTVMGTSAPTGAGENRWKRLTGQFQEKYPRLALRESWDPDLYAQRKLEVLLAAGSPPETAVLRRQAEIPRLTFLGAVLPVDPYVSKSTVVKKADYYDKILATHTLDGKLYVVPHDIFLYVLFFNKDAFTREGLKPPDLTWDYKDWQDAAIKLTKTAGGGTTGPRRQFGVEMPTWWRIHYMGNAGLPEMEGGVGIAPPEKWAVTYDRQDTIDAYKWQADQWCRYAAAMPSADAGDLSTATEEAMTFQNGKAAMRFVDSTGASGFYDRIKDFQWDVTLAPLADKKKPRINTAIGRGYGLLKGSKNPDGGWAFIEHFNDPRRMLEDVKEAGGGLYGSKVIMESKEYKASPVPPADKNVWVEGLKAARFYPEPGWELSLVVDTSAVTANTGDIWKCKAAPEAVLRPYGQQINKLLKERTGAR